jgi:dihydrodipicolinate synthase/N-acetylneuraminate lyase
VNEKIAELKALLANGVSPAMATPVAEDGYTLKTEVVARLVEFLIGAGAKGLFVGGTTGEGILLEPEQRKALHQAALTAARGRVPLLVHVGANRLDTAMELAQHAEMIGVQAIAAVTPYYYGMDDDSLVTYYRVVGEAAPNTPLLLYDIPHMAVNGITPSLLVRLNQEVPSLGGMKSSRRDAQDVRRLLDAAPDSFILLAGNESIALGLLSLGVDGLISGMSTAVPEPFVAMTKAYGAGDMGGARAYQRLINQLVECLPPGQRIGGIKKILQERGFDVGPPVPPRPAARGPLWPQIDAHLRRFS